MSNFAEIETIRVDMKSMQAALLKARRMTCDIEENKTKGDLLHTSFKLSQFLLEALGEKTVKRLLGDEVCA